MKIILNPKLKYSIFTILVLIFCILIHFQYDYVYDYLEGRINPLFLFLGLFFLTILFERIANFSDALTSSKIKKRNSFSKNFNSPMVLDLSFRGVVDILSCAIQTLTFAICLYAIVDFYVGVYSAFVNGQYILDGEEEIAILLAPLFAVFITAVAVFYYFKKVKTGSIKNSEAGKSAE